MVSSRMTFICRSTSNTSYNSGEEYYEMNALEYCNSMCHQKAMKHIRPSSPFRKKQAGKTDFITRY